MKNPTSRWNGTGKKRTKNCDGCPHLKVGDAAQGIMSGDPMTKKLFTEFPAVEICYQGVAWKFLNRDDDPRKCSLV